MWVPQEVVFVQKEAFWASESNVAASLAEEDSSTTGKVSWRRFYLMSFFCCLKHDGLEISSKLPDSSRETKDGYTFSSGDTRSDNFATVSGEKAYSKAISTSKERSEGTNKDMTIHVGNLQIAFVLVGKFQPADAPTC